MLETVQQRFFALPCGHSELLLLSVWRQTTHHSSPQLLGLLIAELKGSFLDSFAITLS